MSKERIRVDIWASLKPVIEREIERTGLTANELINMALCDYYGLSPSGRRLVDTTDTTATLPVTPSTQVIPLTKVEDEDYI